MERFCALGSKTGPSCLQCAKGAYQHYQLLLGWFTLLSKTVRENTGPINFIYFLQSLCASLAIVNFLTR